MRLFVMIVFEKEIQTATELHTHQPYFEGRNFK